jgi:hypothetical protein
MASSFEHRDLIRPAINNITEKISIYFDSLIAQRGKPCQK